MTNAMLFEGPLLDEVLAEARLCFGADVEIEAANRVRRGGVLGFFASEWFEVWARPSAAVIENPALRLADEDDADTFQSMVANAMADRRMNAGGPVLPEDEYDTALERFFDDDDGPGTAPTRQLVPAGAAAAELVADLPLSSAAAPVREKPAAPTPSVAVDAEPAMPETIPSTIPSTIPAAVALEDAPRGDSVFTPQRAPKTELLWAMLERLDALPAAPALPTVGVVAFVGEAAAALDAVRRIGERSGLWTGDVAVVTRKSEIEGVPSWLLVHDLDELSTMAERWRQRGRVVPVIIDQGAEAGDRNWALTAVTHLEADQVRLVVEAWRLPEDVGRLAGKLGGADAIELVSVTDTVEPLAMLDLAVPLGSIDTRPASPELMAAVWLENRRRA